jgi:response regulator RpfG family c-di-GMP phosphodiesterase
MNSYVRDFIVRIILLFLGFFILILFTGIWLANYHIVLPINSITARANDFAYSTDGLDESDHSVMEDNLEKIKSLDIRTGDEVENLYDAFVKMTEDSVTYTKNIKEQSEAISELQRGLIMTMADMVEGRDSDTGNHIRKTAAYARIIMDGLRDRGYYSEQLTDKFVHDVERSAPLHDIGKISVSDVILNKPGKLTEEEFEIMKTHTTAGKELLDKVIDTVNGESYLDEGRNLAAYHHEKWNGTGYPEGLAGEDIPLSARIMAIADVFDAVSSKRCYKDAIPFDKAVSIIKEDSGTHFDPKCVEAFMDNIDRVKEVLDYYNALEAGGKNVRGREKKQNN